MTNGRVLRSTAPKGTGSMSTVKQEGLAFALTAMYGLHPASLVLAMESTSCPLMPKSQSLIFPLLSRRILEGLISVRDRYQCTVINQISYNGNYFKQKYWKTLDNISDQVLKIQIYKMKNMRKQFSKCQCLKNSISKHVTQYRHFITSLLSSRDLYSLTCFKFIT